MNLFLLLAAHALCDFPLQGDYLARGKNHTAPIPGSPWPILLLAHALIHGGAVAIITGQVWLGVAETAAHCAIDHAKCGQRISYQVDQALHVACKVAWYWLALRTGATH